MRTIHRDIVGGFIFSKDCKLLLGKNRKEGVYEGQFVVPAGGSEKGETKLKTLHREMMEETGIDITTAEISHLHTSSGMSEKTLQTGERVLVDMDFHDYRIDLKQNACDVVVKTDSDWNEAAWFDVNRLGQINICKPTLDTLIAVGIIKY